MAPHEQLPRAIILLWYQKHFLNTRQAQKMPFFTISKVYRERRRLGHIRGPLLISVGVMGHRISLRACQVSMFSVLLTFLSPKEVEEKQLDVMPESLLTSERGGLSFVPSHDCPEHKTPS